MFKKNHKGLRGATKIFEKSSKNGTRKKLVETFQTLKRKTASQVYNLMGFSLCT